MAYTLVRGGAIVGLRLCGNCKDNYYEQNLKERPKCQICDHVIMDGISVTICRLCSLETCVCQQCGCAVAADDDTLKEKKKRKKNVKVQNDLHNAPDRTEKGNDVKDRVVGTGGSQKS